MGSNHAVSGVVSGKLISSLLFGEGLLSVSISTVSSFCVPTYLSVPHLKRLSLLFIFPILSFVSFLMIPTDSYLENIGLPVSKERGRHKE